MKYKILLFSFLSLLLINYNPKALKACECDCEGDSECLDSLVSCVTSCINTIRNPNCSLSSKCCCEHLCCIDITDVAPQPEIMVEVNEAKGHPTQINNWTDPPLELKAPAGAKYQEP